MDNLFESKEIKDFYVWVDPKDYIANHNLNEIGTFLSTDLGQNAPKGYISIYHPHTNTTEQDNKNLMFTENHSFTGLISIFQANLLWQYEAEYNLELSRVAYYKKYPSRLVAVFLFETKKEANKYYERHLSNSGRQLRHVRTVGKYKYSLHDLSWVDFLRLKSSKFKDNLHPICDSYWRGISVEQCKLEHWGKPWTESPIYEVLLLGRVDLVK